MKKEKSETIAERVNKMKKWEPIKIDKLKPEQAVMLDKNTNVINTGDMVNKPKHYTSHLSGIECIDVVRHMGFCLGNVVKYVWRADLKGSGLEDLKKARYYIDDEIKKRENSIDKESK